MGHFFNSIGVDHTFLLYLLFSILCLFFFTLTLVFHSPGLPGLFLSVAIKNAPQGVYLQHRCLRPSVCCHSMDWDLLYKIWLHVILKIPGFLRPE